MSRTVPALLVLLLLAGTVAAVPSSRASAIGGPPDPAATLSGLAMQEPTRSSITTQSLDIGTAVAIQRVEATSRLDRRSLSVSFERTETDQARRALLLRAATDVEIAISELRTSQRELRSRYLAGEITTAAYVGRQIALNDRADQLSDRLLLIRRLAGEVPQLSMDSRTSTLRATLLGFGGPVTDLTRAAVTGEATTARVYLSVSSNGSVLSTIADDQYLREAYRDDHWTPDSTGGVGFEGALARVEELYPAFGSNQSGAATSLGTFGPEGTNLGDAGIYQIGIQRIDSSTVAYLDGETELVFKEVQRLGLSTFESRPAVTAVDNETRLVVNRTATGGPLRIATHANATGEPVDALVVVDGYGVRTGPDGVAWALMPRDRVRVTAVTQAGNVSASVAAVPFESIDDRPTNGSA